MNSKSIAWLKEDESENLKLYGIHFERAKEVINNPASLAVRNIHGDYSFIGFTDDLIEILVVYCRIEESIRRILLARKATLNEQNSLFLKIAGAENEEA